MAQYIEIPNQLSRARKVFSDPSFKLPNLNDLSGKRREGGITDLRQLAAEVVVAAAGRVYYKLSESYLRAFEEDSIGKLPMDSFEMPFDAFDILLPFYPEAPAVVPGYLDKVYAVRCFHSRALTRNLFIGKWPEALMDSWYERIDTRPETATIRPPRDFVGLVTHGVWAGESHISTQSALLPVDPNKTFSECLEDAFPSPYNGPARSIGAPADYFRKLARTFATLSMLAIGHDRIIEPDVLSKDLAKYRDAVRDKRNEDVEKIKNRAYRRRGNRRGFMIGHRNEQSLIRRSASASDAPPSANHGELSYQHVRAGHLHGYHTSRGYVVKWVKPVTVRPDLPPDPKKIRGYRV